MTVKDKREPKPCKFCGAIFTRKKSTALYCSGVHREAANMEKRKTKRLKQCTKG